MEEDIEEKDMTPILIKDLGMEYPTEISKRKGHYGIFKCPYCGKEFKAVLANVKRENTKSCGCFLGNRITHGLTKHRFYPTWNNMKKRCYDKKSLDYPTYGGRGITVCEEWLDVRNFIKWADETYINEMTLDRIDNNKGYFPDNCRWADKTTQVINRRKAKNNTSGYTGVIWHKGRKAWYSTISVNKKRISLGYFKDKMDAVKARDDYITENKLPHKLSTKY